MSSNEKNDNRISATVIVCSDRAAAGVYDDETGPAVCAWLEENGLHPQRVQVIPDGKAELQAKVADAVAGGNTLVVVAGGTGLGPRDMTPGSLTELCDFEIPGFGEKMRRESENHSPNAALSRCGAWAKAGALVIAVAGKPKAAREQLAILGSLIPRALRALAGTCHHESHGEEAP